MITSNNNIPGKGGEARCSGRCVNREESMAPPLEMSTTTTTRSNQAEAAGRMPSMEWEPKTLTLDQIKFARVSTAHIYCTSTMQLHMHSPCPCRAPSSFISIMVEYLYVVTRRSIDLLPPKSNGLFSITTTVPSYLDHEFIFPDISMPDPKTIRIQGHPPCFLLD